MDTASLLDLGIPQSAPMLNSFYQDRSTAQSQTSQLRSSIKQWIDGENRVRILVTHQVNISALVNEYVGSGEMLIVTFAAEEAVVLARIPGN